MEFAQEDVLAEVLSHAVAGKYTVIEFRTGDDGVTHIADITEHHQALEETQTKTNHDHDHSSESRG